MSTTKPSDMLAVEYRGPVAILSLNRPAKRNAINDATIRALRDFFSDPRPEIKAAIIQGMGEHF
jgi:enoyl-CoA hydratase/carnithine racemase